MPDQKAHHHWI